MAITKGIFGNESAFNERFISDYRALEERISNLKAIGLRIVLTQGVYDLLHEGHARYLEAGRAHGDILVVGVDSDELTRKRKGPRRPIVPQEERLRMLSYLRCVDLMTLRDVSHGMDELIETVRPDVLITSETTSDFTEEAKKKLQECCGEIITLPPQSTVNTTARIRLLSIDGAGELAEKLMVVVKDHLNGEERGIKE